MLEKEFCQKKLRDRADLKYAMVNVIMRSRCSTLLLTRIAVYWQFLKMADGHCWEQLNKIGDSFGLFPRARGALCYSSMVQAK